MPVIISKAMASYLADRNFSLTSPRGDGLHDMAYLQGTYSMTDPKTEKPMTDIHIIETGAESYRLRRTLEVRQKKKAS